MIQKTEALEKIGQFVNGLEGTVKEITLRAISIPNRPDCQPEVLSLLARYGDDYCRATEEIEKLRQELGGANYDWLQSQLKRAFYDQEMIDGFMRVAEQNDYSNW